MTDLADVVTTLETPRHPGAALPPPVFAPPTTPLASAIVPPPPPTLQPVATHGMPPDLPEYRPPAVTAPALPQVAAPVIPPVAAAPVPMPGTAAVDFAALIPSATQKKKKRSGGKSFVKFIFMLVLLAGIAGAGYVYGPTILEDMRKDESATEPPVSAEPEAPMAFPTPTEPPIEVRNATFVVDEIDPDGSIRRYEITTDFETRVSRVLIDREDLPTLEVMTFLDSAVVRRVDDNVWYQTARGQFPLDDQLERNRWVRHLDELIPTVHRSSAAIEASTTALLAGERMRHLIVAINPALLAGPTLASDSLDDPTVMVGQEATDVAAAPVADPATERDVALPESAIAAPGATAPGSVSIEMWIDSRGLIRQLITPEALGGETLTVTAISPDAWLPEFPTEEQIEPLTASALVKLGL